jgi:hypothetical protein
MGTTEGRVNFYHDPAFDIKEALQTILGPCPGEEALGVGEQAPPGTDPEVAGMCSYPPLTPEQERHLFRKMNCLKYLAYLADCEDEKRDYLTQAMWVRNIILKHNLRLVFSVLKPYAKKPGCLQELFNEASVWMMTEFIDAYDFRGDVPFGAFAAGCLRRRVWGYLSKQYKGKELTGEYQFCDIEDHRKGEEAAAKVDDEFERLREYLYDHVKDETTLDILFRRLGLCNGRIESFQEIAKAHGIRYQTIQERFDTAMVRLFGHTVNGNFIRSLQGKKKDHDRRRQIPSVRVRDTDA